MHSMQEAKMMNVIRALKALRLSGQISPKYYTNWLCNGSGKTVAPFPLEQVSTLLTYGNRWLWIVTIFASGHHLLMHEFIVRRIRFLHPFFGLK